MKHIKKFNEHNISDFEKYIDLPDGFKYTYENGKIIIGKDGEGSITSLGTFTWADIKDNLRAFLIHIDRYFDVTVRFYYKSIRGFDLDDKYDISDLRRELVPKDLKFHQLWFIIKEQLPSINDTPPIHRKSRENYMQFYYNGVCSAINSL